MCLSVRLKMGGDLGSIMKASWVSFGEKNPLSHQLKKAAVRIKRRKEKDWMHIQGDVAKLTLLIFERDRDRLR